MALVVAKLDSMSETLPRSQVRSFSTLYDQLAGSGATAAALGATVWLDRCAKYGAVAGRAGDAAKYYARGFPDTCQFLVEEAEGVGRAAAAARVAAAAGRDARIADMLKTKQVRGPGAYDACAAGCCRVCTVSPGSRGALSRRCRCACRRGQACWARSSRASRGRTTRPR